MHLIVEIKREKYHLYQKKKKNVKNIICLMWLWWFHYPCHFKDTMPIPHTKKNRNLIKEKKKKRKKKKSIANSNKVNQCSTMHKLNKWGPILSFKIGLVQLIQRKNQRLGWSMKQTVQVIFSTPGDMNFMLQGKLHYCFLLTFSIFLWFMSWL